MTTYIAGYDGSDSALAALRFAKRLAGAAHADVLAVSVFHQRSAGRRDERPDGAGEPRPGGHATAEAIPAELDVPDVSHLSVGAPSTAEGLHRLAEDQQASLVVVGVTHRGVIGRLVPGSVAEHLLHGTPCPVAVVPASYADAPLGAVAVAYDERPESLAALATAEEIARRLGARLVLVAVQEPLATPAVGAGLAAANTELEEESREELEAEVARVAGGIEGLEVERRVVRGPAGTSLVDAAADVDLLVMGSRGYGPARSVLLGSVSRHVVDHAPCPVLVVPRHVEGDVLGRSADR